MKRLASGLFILLFAVSASPNAVAQERGQGRGGGGRGRGAAPACETLQCDMLRDFTNTRDLVIGVINAMPEDKFGFKPTPAQQSFGERVMHIVTVDLNLLGGLGGKTAKPEVNAKAATKADILAAAQASFAYGEAVIKEFNDQQLVERIAPPMAFLGNSSRVRLIEYDLAHTEDIYGQLVVYLRLNGITPPASQRPGV